jgi:hypothetical protein
MLCAKTVEAKCTEQADHGNGVVTRVLLDKLQRREARVEFVPLKKQYLHLAPLVGVA